MTCDLNHTVADKLREIAELLEQQGADRFRVQAYRRAAQTVDTLEENLAQRFDRQGTAGLESLPAVGKGIARTLAEMMRSGRSRRLEDLRGELDPERLFRTIPGIGPRLAMRIHQTLGVETLEDLEIAAHDGRLQRLAGVGERRAESIRSALQSMLGRRVVRNMAGQTDLPPVAMLLDVDAEYRDRAARGELEKIAPRRFNPQHEKWLPVLHTDRSAWHFTVLFSNTSLAHQLHRTRDWVVIFHRGDDAAEGQSTAVTETRGRLAGRRVVRGREAECLTHYFPPM